MYHNLIFTASKDNTLKIWNNQITLNFKMALEIDDEEIIEIFIVDYYIIAFSRYKVLIWDNNEYYNFRPDIIQKKPFKNLLGPLKVDLIDNQLLLVLADQIVIVDVSNNFETIQTITITSDDNKFLGANFSGKKLIILEFDVLGSIKILRISIYGRKESGYTFEGKINREISLDEWERTHFDQLIVSDDYIGILNLSKEDTLILYSIQTLEFVNEYIICPSKVLIENWFVHDNSLYYIAGEFKKQNYLYSFDFNTRKTERFFLDRSITAASISNNNLICGFSDGDIQIINLNSDIKTIFNFK